MKKLFFKPLLSIKLTLIALVFCTSKLFCTPGALPVSKLIIWATVDEQISNKKTINELYNFLAKNYQEIFKKDIKMDDAKKPHMRITVAGIIKYQNGKKYVITKGSKVLLDNVIKAIDKAVANNKIMNKNELKFNLKQGSRFSDPIITTDFYIIQEALLKKNHAMHKLGHAITKELSNIGLSPSDFKPNVNSTHVYSNDKHALGQFIYLQNRGNFWKILQGVPGRKDLTFSKIQVLIDKGNNYTPIKTYDLKK